jgi:hypothetical protein
LRRASVFPSERKICFEFLKGLTFQEPGDTLYIADFDAQRRTINDLKVVADREAKPLCIPTGAGLRASPRWCIT